MQRIALVDAKDLASLTSALLTGKTDRVKAPQQCAAMRREVPRAVIRH